MQISMIPNDIFKKTIHISKGDTSLRKLNFELYDDNGLIDTSDVVVADMSYKTYESGNEKLLPINTSAPTTSPLNATINSEDEYFVEQETTEQTNTINVLKGNSVAFNQLIQYGDFSSDTNWRGQYSSLSMSDNACTATITTLSTSASLVKSNVQYIANHTYLVYFDFTCSQDTDGLNINFYIDSSDMSRYDGTITANTKTRVSFVKTYANTGKGNFYIYPKFSSPALAVDEYFIVENVNIIDLTLLQDSHITDYSSFKQYFPLDYYEYNTGEILNFNGTGILSSSKNLFNLNRQQGDTTGWMVDNTNKRDLDTSKYYVKMSANNYLTINNMVTSYEISGNSISVNGRNGYGIAFPIDCEPNTQYYLSADGNNINVGFYKSDGTYISFLGAQNNKTFTTPNECEILTLVFVSSFWSNIQLELGTTKTDYVKYNQNTFNLPVSLYPTGLKSAGTVYDEITENGYIQRIGTLTFDGSSDEAWNLNNLYSGFYINVSTMLSSRNSLNGLCDKLPTIANRDDGLGVVFGVGNQGVYFPQFQNIAGTTVAELRTYLASNPITINYVLAEEVETKVSQAKLVTDNTEIPLSYDNGELVGESTSELSENAGIFLAKIKLTDGDDVVYSEQINLFVEGI